MLTLVCIIAVSLFSVIASSSQSDRCLEAANADQNYRLIPA
jgi:hypothetical protein